MARRTSTGKSFGYCTEELGWEFVEIVEKWNSHVRRGDGGKGIKQDFMGFADLIAVTGRRIIAVQACGRDLGPHKRKLEAEPRVYAWLGSGGHLEIQAWRKVKVKRGGKATRWSPRRIAVTTTGDGLCYEDIR